MEAEFVDLRELITALEQATLMAKQLPNRNTSDPSQFLPFYSSIHTAHHQISIFLSRHQPPRQPPPPPENLGDGDNDAVDPMQVGDDDEDVNDEAEQNVKNTISTAAAGIEGVEERMRDCFIQNKRLKRPLSPSAVAEQQRRSYENEVAFRGGSLPVFDPQGTKSRSFDLIYQFHG